jgi:hypothetical protein
VLTSYINSGTPTLLDQGDPLSVDALLPFAEEAARGWNRRIDKDSTQGALLNALKDYVKEETDG